VAPSPRHILVVEDEALVALELQLSLTEAGFAVLGPAPTVAAALALLAKHRPDAAVLDASLRGERVTPVAEALARLGVPFVLASAYGASEFAADPALAGARNLGKPTHPAALLRALREMVRGA